MLGLSDETRNVQITTSELSLPLTEWLPELRERRTSALLSYRAEKKKRSSGGARSKRSPEEAARARLLKVLTPEQARLAGLV